MKRRDVALVAIAIVVAVGCARLGFWQLQRLQERRAHNATVLGNYAQASLPLTALAGSPDALRYRRVTISGTYDPAHEFVLANRPRRGSPGVHLLTPLRPHDSDTAVLVLRGWIYAPDATHAERDRWREDSTAGATGYIQTFDAPTTQPAVLENAILRRLDHATIARSLPYPLAPYLVVLTDAGDTVAGAPPRLDPPVLGEGNHLSYAFQWFAFGVIALSGTLVFLWHSSRAARREQRFQPT